MYDQYGNQVYQDPNAYNPYNQGGDQQQLQQSGNSSGMNRDNNYSIGSLAPLNPMGSAGSFGKMIKTDSHAVLMELFARDQDLVRQAAGRGGMVPQQGSNLRWASGTAAGAPSPSNPMGQRKPSVTWANDGGVSSLSAWPNFSSVSSLNNLGGLSGVKSITNLSAADLSSQGNLNKMGNLAQVKSIENMVRVVCDVCLERNG